jgi:serine O-acetyltransferase
MFQFARVRLKRQSIRLGITLPINVFGPGLTLAHYGSIVVNDAVMAGSNVRIHNNVNIGVLDGRAPVIGDYVYIGPGAVLYGGITVGDRSVIGANSVVGRDVPAGVTVAGAPARIVSNRDSSSVMPKPGGMSDS